MDVQKRCCSQDESKAPSDDFQSSESDTPTLSPIKQHMLDEQNTARTKLGLPPIQLRYKKCNLCDKQFITQGNRNCGCSYDLRRNSTSIMGHAVL